MSGFLVVGWMALYWVAFWQLSSASTGAICLYRNSRHLLAEDCLRAQLNERLLWRKQTLKVDTSAAIRDPIQTFVVIRISGAYNP